VIVKLAVDNQRAIGSAAARRYESYQLADELRQTSDDLTRMARLFVVSGEARFKDYFGAIRDIRDGKMSRPVDYHRIYWDYVTASGQKPRASMSTIAAMVKGSWTMARSMSSGPIPAFSYNSFASRWVR